MSVPSSRAAAAPSEADAREAEFAGALLELADGAADGAAPDDARPGAGEADGSHAKLTALAVHARHRLAREGRACETAALLGAPSEADPVRHGYSGALAARLRHVEHEQREGPATDTLRTGTALSTLPLNGAAARWPRYAPAALEAGVCAVHTVALPDIRSDHGAGVLVVHLDEETPLGPAATAALTALARACALGLAHRTALRRGAELKRALGSRVVIEQAKGVLAERRNGSVDDAFRTLRAYARSRQRPLHQVAREVVEAQLLDPPFQRPAAPPPARRNR
ncbi:ANTAR domain-containing protein [Streptomyces sp. B15]|uniref:ANTAR domain-containing protein n=1 Tax=Streptomyces sp. B15 TaxID=1537797 RepID=UPI001B35DC18|nr:ANTAR domain-containing protein [Streptomyces sp. B15]MBQ1124017.1 ANTAR domain-containing protein [Streptomyces sp. B15]